MLLTEKVKVKWHGSNRKNFESLGYKWTKRGDELEIPVEHLPSGSNVKVKVKCDYCGVKYTPMWKDFLNGRKKGVSKDACGNDTCRKMKANEIKNGFYTTVADVPELLKEWCPTNDVDPSRVLANSHVKYKWICSVDESHTWKSRVFDRTRGSDCPSCNVSKGEKLVASILEDLGVDFSREVEFPNGKLIGEGNGFLRYDFGILLNGQLIALIEYDGGQHFKPIEHFGGQAGYERLVRHDTLKDEYAELNNLSLLRIRYDMSEGEIKRQVTDFVESCLSFERLLNNVKVYG